MLTSRERGGLNDGHAAGSESSNEEAAMADVLDPRRYTEAEYRAARAELIELHGADFDWPAGSRVDELLAMIENYEGTMRFVPEFPDESWQHAA
jgi:hypothetical protein